MRFTITMALLMSTQSFAQDFVPKNLAFDFWGKKNGERIELSCELAGRIIKSHFEELGARNIQVGCENELETWSRPIKIVPMSFDIIFEVPLPKSREFKFVKVLNSKNFLKEDCYFNVELLGRAVSHFPSVIVDKSIKTCDRNDSPWTFEVRVAE